MWIDYPGYPRLRLFTDRELGDMLRHAGLGPVRAWAVHAVSNLLPSTLLHRERLALPLRGVYRALCAADTAVSGWRGARAFAAHGVLLARKPP
jgi:hypothetical protein